MSDAGAVAFSSESPGVPSLARLALGSPPASTSTPPLWGPPPSLAAGPPGLSGGLLRTSPYGGDTGVSMLAAPLAVASPTGVSPLSVFAVSIKSALTHIAPPPAASASPPRVPLTPGGASMLVLITVMDVATSYALHFSAHRWSDLETLALKAPPTAATSAAAAGPGSARQSPSFPLGDRSIVQMLVQYALQHALEAATDLVMQRDASAAVAFATATASALSQSAALALRARAQQKATPSRVYLGDTDMSLRLWQHLRSAVGLPLGLPGAAAAAEASARQRMATAGDFRWGCGNGDIPRGADGMDGDDEFERFDFGGSGSSAAMSSAATAASGALSRAPATHDWQQAPLGAFPPQVVDPFPPVNGFPSTGSMSQSRATGTLQPVTLPSSAVMPPPSVACDSAIATVRPLLWLPLVSGPSGQIVLPQRGMKQMCESWNVRAIAPAAQVPSPGFGAAAPRSVDGTSGGSPSVRLLGWLQSR
jgi:hypothetical protein